MSPIFLLASYTPLVFLIVVRYVKFKVDAHKVFARGYELGAMDAGVAKVKFDEITRSQIKGNFYMGFIVSTEVLK